MIPCDTPEQCPFCYAKLVSENEIKESSNGPSAGILFACDTHIIVSRHILSAAKLIIVQSKRCVKKTRAIRSA